MPQQPAGMTSGQGAILTIGLNINTDRCAVVMPFALDGGAFDPASGPEALVESFQTGVLATFMGKIADTNCYASFLSAEGMDDGCVPSRNDFVPTLFPGTDSGTPMPSQVAGLMAFYADPADLAPGARMACAKNFVPGIARSHVIGDTIDATYVTGLAAFALSLQTGFLNAGTGGGTWYRVLAAPRPRGSAVNLKRIINGDFRGYVVTQRRRLTPRG